MQDLTPGVSRCFSAGLIVFYIRSL